jgi:hypothetical protein
MIRILTIAAILSMLCSTLCMAGENQMTPMQRVASLADGQESKPPMSKIPRATQYVEENCCSSTTGNPNCRICCPVGHATVCANPAIPNVGPGTCKCN